MSAQNVVALLPLIVLAATVIAVMVVAAFTRNTIVSLVLTLLGLAGTIGVLPVAASSNARQVTALLVLDNYALFYIGLVAAAGFIVALLSYGYLEGRGLYTQDYYILLLLATLGGGVLAASSHFASFFLGLELLSVSLYALIAYPRVQEGGIEAGIKYLILGGMTVAFTLFGMALVYGELGTMELARIAVPAVTATSPVLLFVGWIMVIVGLGFKLAVVPFHMWVADVYEGAPAPVVALLATTSKGAVFALLLRYFSQVQLRLYNPLFIIMVILSFASMLLGNLLALLQNNLKRVLAYSSIAHFGYLLVALLAGGAVAGAAITFYLVAYFAASLAAFGVISGLSTGERDTDMLADYRGLAGRRPGMAAILTLALFSLAGIPLTIGFIGKYYVLNAGTGAALWILVITLVITSVIGLFYYLRIVIVLYSATPQEERTRRPAQSFAWMGGVALLVLAAALLVLGIYPTPMVRLIQQTMLGFIP